MALALRFDRQTYTFAKPEQSTSPTCNLKALLNEVIGEGNGYCNDQNYHPSFNDLGFYMNLCAREGCTKVEISGLNVFHNIYYCFGVTLYYRLSFSNGNTEYQVAPKHLYRGGYYAYTGGGCQTSSITLQDGVAMLNTPHPALRG